MELTLQGWAAGIGGGSATATGILGVTKAALGANQDPRSSRTTCCCQGKEELACGADPTTSRRGTASRLPVLPSRLSGPFLSKVSRQ